MYRFSQQDITVSQVDNIIQLLFANDYLETGVFLSSRLDFNAVDIFGQHEFAVTLNQVPHVTVMLILEPYSYRTIIEFAVIHIEPAGRGK